MKMNKFFKWTRNTYLIVQIRWILFLIRKHRRAEEKNMGRYKRIVDATRLPR
jgi:hypothetical protein